jgi:hypothetical protein
MARQHSARLRCFGRRLRADATYLLLVLLWALKRCTCAVSSWCGRWSNCELEVPAGSSVNHSAVT